MCINIEFSIYIIFTFQSQGTSKYGFPTKSSVPFTIHEDDTTTTQKASEKFSENNVENHKPLLLKNESKIIEPKVL